MNKKEFLDILYEQLSGQMLEGNVAAHVQYYRNSDPGHGHFRYRMLYNFQTAQLICKNIKKECKS